MDNNKNYIYLDTAASASRSKFDVSDNFANPNAVHDAGRDSFAVLENARETIASCIGAKRPSEIIFTSGATEANNMAIFGISRAAADKRNLRKNFFDGKSTVKPKILCSAIEHESSLMPTKELVNECFDIDLIPVDSKGFIDVEKFKSLLTPQTVLVSIQAANTEIGSIQSLEKLVKIAHDNGTYFHSDFVGLFGRSIFNLSSIGVDSASLSGHKIGAPKGIGVLYLKAKTPFKPLVFGSGQEGGFRAGTQNVALAASMSKATKHITDNINNHSFHFLKLRKYLFTELEKIDGVRFTTDSTYDNPNYLSNIVHLVFKNKSSESLILHYGKYNIQISGGPACSSEDKSASHVLLAIKVPEDEIFGAVRLSFSEDTSLKDLEKFVDATKILLC